jgi:hypothetical protein
VKKFQNDFHLNTNPFMHSFLIIMIIMLRSGFDGSGSWRLGGYRRPSPLRFKVFPATDRLPPGFQKSSINYLRRIVVCGNQKTLKLN